MKPSTLSFQACLLSCAALLCVGPLSAAIVYPSSATTDGGYLTTVADYDVNNLFDEGVSSATDTLDGSASNVGLAYASASPPPGGFPVTIVANFGASVDLGALYLWNITHPSATGPATRGVRDFSLTFYDAPGGAGSQIGSVFTASAASGPSPGGAISSQSFDFGTTYAGVQSVEFRLLNNQSAGSSSWVGLREVAFNQVPEPATGLLVLGAGVLGCIRRRRS